MELYLLIALIFIYLITAAMVNKKCCASNMDAGFYRRICGNSHCNRLLARHKSRCNDVGR